MRGMGFTAVGMQSNGHFSNVRAVERGFDHHFGGKLHPGASLVERLIVFFREAAQSTINVVYVRFEPPARKETEHWVTPPAMQKRHRSGKHFTTTRRQAT